MPSAQKKVSVIMSVFNDEKFVKAAVESVLSSTYSNFEFIICNDKSTDKSWEIVKAFTDPRIKLIENEKNIKLAASLNRCLEIATGEYIMRMDSDDVCLPERMSLQVEYLDAHPEVAFCGGAATVIDEHNTPIRSFCHSENITLKDIFVCDSYIHPTVMLRKSALDTVGGYSTYKGTRRAEDVDLWCKLYKANLHGKNIGQIFILYRESTTILRKKRHFRDKVETYKLLRRWKKQLRLPFKYNFYCWRQILIGLMPKWIIMRIKIRKYNRKRIDFTQD